MKVNAPTTAVSWVSAIQRIQISRNIEHTNIRFAALNVTTLLCVCKRCTKLSRMAKICFHSQEQQDDFLYDIDKSSEAIVQWKAHITRSVNQKHAKQDIHAKLDQSSCLLVMDWAMKFLQLRHKEKESDWYGKRGLSWHISSVKFSSHSGATEVISYAHLFEQCTQDWYAVTSNLKELFKLLKVKNPELQRVYLRSDEARCYHNSSLILAVRVVAKRVGVTVQNYHYSEPQSGKDVCDRILCPMKSSIRTYCNEWPLCSNCCGHEKRLNRTPSEGNNRCSQRCQRIREVTFSQQNRAAQ